MDLKRAGLRALHSKRKPSIKSKSKSSSITNSINQTNEGDGSSVAAVEETNDDATGETTTHATTADNSTNTSDTSLAPPAPPPAPPLASPSDTNSKNLPQNDDDGSKNNTDDDDGDDHLNPSMYFVRILFHHNTDLFKNVIQRCHRDDDALHEETKQWIMGAEDKTLVYTIHDKYQAMLETRLSKEAEQTKRSSKRSSIFSRKSSSSSSSSSSSRSNSTVSTPITSTTAASRPANNIIAMIELVPMEIVPPNSTTMMLTIPNYFSSKDMFDKTFYKYRIRVSNGSLDWKVHRRFKQFAEMHEELLKLWNVSLTTEMKKSLRPLPKLPKKTFLLQKNTDVKFLSLRKIQLEKYMNLMKIHPWGSFQVPYLSFTGLLSNTRDEKEAEGRHVIHVSRLEEFVNVGDVILFKSSNMMSGLQRVATRSEWDHCGIVVKLRRGQLFLLESTGDGVGCYPLKNRIRAYGVEFARYMAVRRLLGPRNRNFMVKLVEFTNQVNGAKYKLGFRKLMTSQTLKESSKDGFFCSELVAAAWQEVKAMKDDKAPNAYWPTDFGENGKIESILMESYALEPTVLIDTRVVEVARAHKHVYDTSSSSDCTPSANPAHETKSSSNAQRFGMGGWGT